MYELTKHEEFILLSVCKLIGNAYIVTIRKEISELTGKSINYGSLCNTLYSLVRKGYIRSQESEPQAQQGGRRKVMYHLTTQGKKALQHTYEIQKHAWDGVKGTIMGVD
ncbi:PadR family transcriptional regulator [candidate division KSB1 bacterium]